MFTPFKYHPKTNKPDAMWTLTCFTVLVCNIKFLLEGVSFHIYGRLIDFGHADAMIYGALLTPVLGAHGYISAKTPSAPGSEKVDNPDAK